MDGFQPPVNQQIPGGGVGVVALACCVPKRSSLALLPERLLADGSAFILCINITELTQVRKFCDLL